MQLVLLVDMLVVVHNTALNRRRLISATMVYSQVLIHVTVHGRILRCATYAVMRAGYGYMRGPLCNFAVRPHVAIRTTLLHMLTYSLHVQIRPYYLVHMGIHSCTVLQHVTAHHTAYMPTYSHTKLHGTHTRYTCRPILCT